MFERRKAEKAAESWQAERDEYAGLLRTAQIFKGTGASELMLAAGEAVFYKVTSVSLVEDRKTKGRYEGRSQGVSIPVGRIGGRSVRYRVGASRGHYVQGAAKPTAIDTGTVYITNKRVIFQGAKQTRECAFAKLLGFRHDEAEGSTTLSVSNRQKPTTIHYGPKLSGSFDFRLDLALAHFKGTVPQLVSQLQAELARIDADRPGGLAPAPGPVRPPSAGPESPGAWLRGPGGQAFDAVRSAFRAMLDAPAKLSPDASEPETLATLTQAYGRVADAATAAMAAPPVPDQAGQVSWSLMLSSCLKSAMCYRAALEANNEDLARQGREHRDKAIRQMQELMNNLDRMRQPREAETGQIAKRS